jgi:hypothetical protein
MEEHDQMIEPAHGRPSVGLVVLEIELALNTRAHEGCSLLDRR